MSLVENVAIAWLTVFALLLAVVALLAYRRTGNGKMLGIAAAFAVFFVKGLALSVALFTSTGLESLLAPVVVLDTVALLGFYLAALK